MKLKQLKGIWKDTAESYQQSFASDVAGWHYSRYRMGENVEEKAITNELQEFYPEICGLELNPFTVIIHVKDAGVLKSKYRSTGTQIGYTYRIVRR